MDTVAQHMPIPWDTMPPLQIYKQQENIVAQKELFGHDICHCNS